jgi:hypothetical protein
VAGLQPSQKLESKKLVRLHELTEELSTLARTPIGRLFHL